MPLQLMGGLDLQQLAYALIIILVWVLAQRTTIAGLKKLLTMGEATFRKGFRDQVTQAETINALLDHIMFDLTADRVYIFQYHNGGTSIAGIPFARCTNTHERCILGINPNINLYQNLPLAMYGFRHDLIADGNLISVVHLDDIKLTDISSYNLMKSQGIKSLYIMGLFDMENLPVGFIGIEYTREDKTLNEDQLKELKTAAQKISGCLEPKR